MKLVTYLFLLILSKPAAAGLLNPVDAGGKDNGKEIYSVGVARAFDHLLATSYF